MNIYFDHFLLMSHCRITNTALPCASFSLINDCLPRAFISPLSSRNKGRTVACCQTPSQGTLLPFNKGQHRHLYRNPHGTAILVWVSSDTSYFGHGQNIDLILLDLDWHLGPLNPLSLPPPIDGVFLLFPTSLSSVTDPTHPLAYPVWSLWILLPFFLWLLGSDLSFLILLPPLVVLSQTILSSSMSLSIWTMLPLSLPAHILWIFCVCNIAKMCVETSKESPFHTKYG